MLKVSLLNRTFERDAFDCGSAELNLFLRNIAFQAQRRSSSRTYVLHSESQPQSILGFYTLTLCTVAAVQVPAPFDRRYRPQMPGVNLARLGIDKHHQGQGFGGLLLMNALKNCLKIADIAGAAACFVDAKLGARDFYLNYGFIPLASDPNRLFLPTESIRKLFNDFEV